MNFPDPTAPAGLQKPDTLLALTVLGEAEGEPELGKACVAHVVVNRMRQRKKDVAGVCLAPWQFSCWNAGATRKQFLEDVITKQAANIPLGIWASCWAKAHDALSGQSADPTQGATHYCTTNLWGVDDSKRKRPRWHSMQELASGRTRETFRLGGHVFGVAP